MWDFFLLNIGYNNIGLACYAGCFSLLHIHDIRNTIFEMWETYKTGYIKLIKPTDI